MRGHLHGDLHLRNILVRRDSYDYNYWLVDFALSHDNFLGYDHAYLEFSLLKDKLASLEERSIAKVLRAIDSRTQTEAEQVESENDLGVVQLIRDLRREIDGWQQNIQPGRGTSVYAQLCLARIAAGLNWANKKLLTPPERRAAIIYASWALGTYIEKCLPDVWAKEPPTFAQHFAKPREQCLQALRQSESTVRVRKA